MTINQKAAYGFTTTLAALRKAGACLDGYNKVVRDLQGLPFTSEDSMRNSYIRFKPERPISLLSILVSNGFDDAMWALRCVPEVDRDARLYAVWCARQVQSLMTDPRSIEALKVVERFANGEATQEELDAARIAAEDAAEDAAGAAAKDAQKGMFIAMCNGKAPWQKSP